VTPRHPTPNTTDYRAARQHAHQDIDRIFDHHDAIAELASGRALTASRTDRQGGTSIGTHSDPTPTAAMRPDQATDWLNEYTEARAHWTRLAQRTHLLDPPQAKRLDRDLDLLSLCVLCEQPIEPGLNPLDHRSHAVRVDSIPLHRRTCYPALWRRSLRERTTVGVLAQRLADAQTAKAAR
jgi:hypothetical protein